MHKLEDKLLITATLLRRFLDEAGLYGGDDRHYAMIQRSNGHLHAHHPGSPNLPAEQSMWAADILTLLNNELHHDGAWVLVFTHPIAPKMETVLHDATKHWEYARYALIFIDADGDPQFSMEWARGEGELHDFTDVLLAGPVSTAQKAQAAWELWTEAREVMDPQDGQTFKRAQGQTPRSALH